MRAWCLVLLLFCGCEKDAKKEPEKAPVDQPDPPPPQPPGPKDPSAAARLKVIEFMESLAAAVDDNKDNCAAMTLAVGDVVDRNKPLVDIVKKVRARGDSAQKQGEPGQVAFHDKTLDEYGDRVAEAKRKLAGLDLCIPQSPKLAEMMGEMGKK
jgi:hypothetical protein